MTYQRADVEVAREAIVGETELTLMGVPPARIDAAREPVPRHLSAFRTAPRTLRLPIAYLIVTARNDDRVCRGSLE